MFVRDLLQPWHLLVFLVPFSLIGLFTGWLAWYWKAENFFVWFVFGTLFPLVTLLVLLVMPTKEGARERRAIREGTAKRCPYCAEMIRVDARVCRYCQREQPI